MVLSLIFKEYAISCIERSCWFSLIGCLVNVRKFCCIVSAIDFAKISDELSDNVAIFWVV